MAKRKAGSQTASLTPDQKKLGIDPIYLGVDNVRHIVGKLSMRATTFSSNCTSIGGLLAKLWCPKVAGVPRMAISGLPLGSPETKSHLDVGPVASHRVYNKGEGGGFPQVRAMVSLVCLCCPWFVRAPKVLQLCTNHLCELCAGPCE
jgi:3-deoxy-D-manno-octulosonate 8-phosphate phosphatase KdsC-like HAD superfamily phosphatase